MDFFTTFSNSTIAFIVVIGLLVFVHEFGHYWMALWNGVKVEVFSIGFGPEIYGWNNKRGTRWRIALVPLGGYVKMFGDEDPASVEHHKDNTVALTPEQRSQAFFAKSIGQRAAIVAAGPLINFLFTLIVLAGLYLTVGQPRTLPYVESVTEGMPAQMAGIKAGDTISSVNGQKVDRFQDIQEYMALNLDKPVDIGINRDGQALTFHIIPTIEDVQNHRVGRLGIMGQKQEFSKLSPGKALYESVADTFGIIKSTLVGLSQIIMNERSTKELGSVISIAKISGDMVNTSLTETAVALLWFMAVLSANLGLINLFPIPVLDGGHLLFYAIEAIRRRPLSEKAMDYSLRFGLAIVVSIMIFAFWNDLKNFGVVDFISNLIL